MAFCPNCGSQLNEGARFCAACGSPVAAPAPVAEPAPAPAPAEPVYQAPAEPVYQAPAELVAELERNVRITDGIFKFVTVKLAEEVEVA